MPGTPYYSYLHNHRSGQALNYAQLRRGNWLQQGKRLRLAFLALLADASLTLFCTYMPQFTHAEFWLPLPCDDAVWAAPDASQCAASLGLHGPHYQAQLNQTGSLKSHRSNSDFASRTLQDQSIWILQPRNTNVYAEFILLHALNADLWQLWK